MFTKKNKCRYAKERDEHIEMLEGHWRFTSSEVMSMLMPMFGFTSVEEFYRDWHLDCKRNRRNKKNKKK